MKINTLEFENVKRIKAVKLEPTPNGLTVIGGNNGQGKTSVLDAIAWLLGGEKYRPSQPEREGSYSPPYLKITMENGLVAERKGKNSALTVTDPEGRRGGQQLLNEFISQFAIDLPRFMNANAREKAETLLRIIGVGDKLTALERQEMELYSRRHAIGQIAEQKAKYAAELTEYPEAPDEPVSASELIRQQQDILARNGENQRKRESLDRLRAEDLQLESMIRNAQRELSALLDKQRVLKTDLETAKKTAAELVDESTAEIEKSLEEIETINIKVRANLDKAKATEDAAAYKSEYDGLTDELNAVRQNKADLLNSADLPLPGLSVENGELTYLGKKWDGMSGAEQLKASTAIVRKLNPKCGFVLLDKLEQMDLKTLEEFGAWLEAEGLQAIATRVSTGDECSVIIEDGYIVGEAPKANKLWKEGEF